MQNFIITLLMAADVFIALIIITLVLVQQSKEGALGSSFGGVGESVFGAQAGGHLTKLTVIFSVLFLSITLALAIIIGHRAKPKSLLDKELSVNQISTKESPETPSENKAPDNLIKKAENAAEDGKKEAEKILNNVSDVLKNTETKSSPDNNAIEGLLKKEEKSPENSK